MSFLKTLTILISAIPELIRLIRELQSFVKDYNEREAFKQRMQDLKEGINQARTTKDTSKLEEFFNGPKPQDEEPKS